MPSLDDEDLERCRTESEIAGHQATASARPEADPVCVCDHRYSSHIDPDIDDKDYVMPCALCACEDFLLRAGVE